TSHQFLARRAEGRAVLVWDQVVHGQIAPIWFQPVEDRLQVIIPVARIEGAKKRVLEHPVKEERGLVAQEILDRKARLQSCGGRPGVCQFDSRGRDITPEGI